MATDPTGDEFEIAVLHDSHIEARKVADQRAAEYYAGWVNEFELVSSRAERSPESGDYTITFLYRA